MPSSRNAWVSRRLPLNAMAPVPIRGWIHTLPGPPRAMPARGTLPVDRQVLLDPVGWLTNSIMNASQQLLRNAFPNLNSLQDVGIGNMMC